MGSGVLWPLWSCSGSSCWCRWWSPAATPGTAGSELADSGRTLQRRRAVDPVVHADDRAGRRSTATRCAPAVSCRSTCTRCGVAPWPAWSRSPSSRWSVRWSTAPGCGRRRCCSTSPSSATCWCCARSPAASGSPRAGQRRAAAREALRTASGLPGRAAAPRRPRSHETVAPARCRACRTRACRWPRCTRCARAGSSRARTPAPAGWQHSAVVGLDDDDIGFADIDVYQPRRVANA